MRHRSKVAVIIVRVIFIGAFLFYCLLLKHSFPTNPNKMTNCFQLILFYLQTLQTTFAQCVRLFLIFELRFGCFRQKKCLCCHFVLSVFNRRGQPAHARHRRPLLRRHCLCPLEHCKIQRCRSESTFIRIGRMDVSIFKAKERYANGALQLLLQCFI